MPKKTWNRNKIRVLNIGPCRYCKKEMTNDESFVSFMVGEPKNAHYACMKKDEDLKEKNLNAIENEIEQAKS